MSQRLTIGDDVVEPGGDCYVIAEIGNNHQGEVEKCKEMFLAAKEAGANAVKLQKRDNKALFTAAMYNEVYNSENSYGRTYGEHRDFLEFGEAEHEVLIAYAKEIGITFFSTPFDMPSADFLEKLDMPAYKIASGDLINTPLIRHVASFGKPMIISTGAGEMDDVKRAYEAAAATNDQICIMQCTSSYPAEIEELNLRVIETYRREFPDAVIGLSSHDNGISMPLIGYLLGAQMVEKHFTLNRAWKGTDQAFSLEPGGLRRLVRDLRRARAALGDGVKRRYENEAAPMKKMHKSVVSARPLAKGHTITPADLAIKVAGGAGLPPYEFDGLIGKVLSADIDQDIPIELDHITR